MNTSIQPMDLTKRFKDGLINYNLSYEEILENNWKYCGGTNGRHYNYYRLLFNDAPFPDKTTKCICGHRIKENCYITDSTRIITLGNCCIKKFIEKNTRTCEKCGNQHKNRVVNRCNQCRIGHCDKCNKIINKKYKKCYRCKDNKN